MPDSGERVIIVPFILGQLTIVQTGMILDQAKGPRIDRPGMVNSMPAHHNYGKPYGIVQGQLSALEVFGVRLGFQGTSICKAD